MKLIVTDLDNTLLRSDKSISEYSVRVFEKCREKGYPVAFATARAERAMERFVREVKPDILISNGGAMINVGGEIIYKNRMSVKDSATIIQMCRRFTDNKGLITAECDEGYYCNFVPTDSDRRAAFTYSDFSDFNTSAYKITAELEREEWGAQIVEACPDCSMIGFTGEKWRRFAAKNADKETALAFLTAHLSIDMRDVVAFGDDLNDIGMLQVAGMAVAVSNAIGEVKAVSHYVTDSNDSDGVAKFIENVLL